MSNLTTLCYIEKDDSYLMLHRIKKKSDINAGKWIGVGGHFLENESPEECLLREVKEETGLTLLNWSLRALITFCSDVCKTEYMFLYTADKFGGILPDKNYNDEGELEWIRKEDIVKLRLWEGDRIFLDLLQKEEKFFSLKLSYIEDKLVEAVKDGTPILLDT